MGSRGEDGGAHSGSVGASGELGGLLNRRAMAVPATAVDKNAGDRHSVVGPTWRRRALGDTLVDELALLQGQVARGRGSGGADLSRGCRAAMAASSWLAGDVARGCLACSGERESVWRGSAVWAKPGARCGGSGAARAKRALWARPEHAH